MNDERSALVIGYGNTLRGDDAVGPRTADAVMGWGESGLIGLAVPQLTPELAEPLSAARLAVFVDARVAVEGDNAEVDFRAIEPTDGSAFGSGHSSDPGRLLAMSRDVYGRFPPAWLVTVPASEFGLGEGLSPRAARGLGDALRLIAALLRPEIEGRDEID